MLWTLTIAVALAQNQPLVPDINSQLYKPTMDSAMTLWTEDTGGIEDTHGDARVFLSYVVANSLLLLSTRSPQ